MALVDGQGSHLTGGPAKAGTDCDLDIIERIKDIDCYLKDIKARRPAEIPEDTLKKFEIKRAVTHKFNLSQNKTDHLSVEIIDRVTFIPDEGPFDIKVVIGANIILSEPLSREELKQIVKDQKNILSIINQCLPHSSAIIAHITDKMGFPPVILSPRIAVNKEESTDESGFPGRRAE